ncbi:hypothetical protein Tco_1561735 [Tanacetum coccineum]
MHTSKDDYLINSLRFVFAKESTQIYGAILPECLTSPAMKESKAYKTYLGYATGVVPPKMALKFKKASPSNKYSDLVPVDEEPVQKGKRIKRPVKKSTTKPAAGVVIREASMETKSKKAHMKEVRMKSLRDFHKTHPSGSGVLDVTEDDSIESKGIMKKTTTMNKNQVIKSVQENESEEQESDSDKEEEFEDDDEKEEEFVHTPTDDKDDDNLESESDDVIKSDEEKEMDDTTYQFDNDVDARLKEPTQTDKEVVQREGADAEMNDAQQGNKNLETTQEQVVEDAHVTISTVTKKTEVPVTSSSCSSDLASKFLKILDIPHADAEIVSLLDSPKNSGTHSSYNTDFCYHGIITFFRFNDRITALEKEVDELKKDPLHTQVTTLVDEHLDTRLGETIEEFVKFLSESLTTRIKEQVKDQLPQFLPKEVSNFAPPVIEKLIKNHVMKLL